MKILIVYATDGQTARIARRLSLRLSRTNHDVRLSDIASLPRSVDVYAFDAILVGGSVHVLGYQRRVKRFVRENLTALQSRPSAFFSVGVAIASRSAKERAAAQEVPRRFCARTGWTPDHVEVIAGALAFSRYGFLRRFFMKRIAEKEMGQPVDTTRDHEFTDWARVDAFASAFARRLERRRRAVAILHPLPDEPLSSGASLEGGVP